jgi:hypothetical protein
LKQADQLVVGVEIRADPLYSQFAVAREGRASSSTSPVAAGERDFGGLQGAPDGEIGV